MDAVLDWESDPEERRPMSASVSDVASATSILLAVCLAVVLTLTAICRLLRLGSVSSDQRSRCPDGLRCGGGHGVEAALSADDCLPATVPEDQSATSVALNSGQQYSSKIDLYLTHTDCIPRQRPF